MTAILVKKTLQTLVLFLSVNTLSFAEDSITPPRDPFTKTITDLSERKTLGFGLAEYPLVDLRLCGILQLDVVSLAIFRDPRGQLHQLKTGDVVGLEQAKITAIFADKIVLASQHNLKANQPPNTTILNLP